MSLRGPGLAFLVAMIAAACGGSSPGATVSAGGSSTGSGATAGQSLVVGDGATSGTGTGSGASGGAGAIPSGDVCGTTCPAGQSACAPETCDGIDNNCDGIIDNVDKNNDGICDCLLIATLGKAGTWGQGDVFATWLSARSNAGAANLADQTLTPALLAKYEVIVAQDVSEQNGNHPFAPAEVSALQAWINAGGGFMTLIGYADPGEAANVNRLLAPINMSYKNTQILPQMGGSTIPITQWIVQNPIDLGVTAVGIDNGYPVQGGTVFATGGGFNVATSQSVGSGHVLMWGDEWITYDSEWTQHPDYQVQLFWVNAIKWLTAANRCQVAVPPDIGGPVK